MNSALPEGKLTFSVSEFQQLGICGRNSAYGLIHEGRLRAVRVGRKIVIPRAAVEEFLAGGFESGQEEAPASPPLRVVGRGR